LLVFSTCNAIDIPCSCFPKPWPSCFEPNMHYCIIQDSCKYVFIPVLSVSLGETVFRLSLALLYHNAATVST
jgi:hypothetical protein